MNIFYLSACPVTAAQYHCDKHVVKMILETAQLLSTAHRVLDGHKWYEMTTSGRMIARWRLDDFTMQTTLYKASHVNHPSAVWVRQSKANYLWTVDLLLHLLEEYQHRYKRVHKTFRLLPKLVQHPMNIPDEDFTDPPQCMPDQYKCDDAVEAYRNYYKGAKADFASWKNTPTPQWWYLTA